MAVAVAAVVIVVAAVAIVVVAVATAVAAVAAVAAEDAASVNIAVYQDEVPPRRSELPGGAVLLEIPLPRAQVVSFGFWLRRGSASEEPGQEGVAHFLEHIVFKGTERRTALAIAEGFDSVGAVVDAFTTKDCVAFTLKVLPEFFYRALDVLADMLLHPALTPDLIALEQDVVCEEIQEALDTPEDRLHDAFSARVFDGHRRRRPILGTPDTVRSFDHSSLAAAHEKLFAAPNVLLSIAGNIQPGMVDQVCKLFADLPRVKTAGWGEARVAGPDADRRAADELVIESPILQAYFEIGNLGVSTDHPDRVPVLLLSNLLGGGMSSRIFQAVREREGLAYTIYTYTDMGPDTGLVSCAGCCSPDKEARVRDVVLGEYQRLVTSGVTVAELDSNKAQIKSHLVFALEGPHNQMFRAAKNEIFFGRFLPVGELVTQVEAVDTDTLLRCAQTWFDPARLIHATHRPPVV